MQSDTVDAQRSITFTGCFWVAICWYRVAPAPYRQVSQHGQSWGQAPGSFQLWLGSIGCTFLANFLDKDSFVTYSCRLTTQRIIVGRDYWTPQKRGHQGGYYFLNPKWDGGLRPILDLRVLNKYLRPLKCQMLTVPRVQEAINKGNWFATLKGFLLPDTYLGMLLAVSDVSVRRPTNSESSPSTLPWPLGHSQGVWTQSWHPYVS